MAFDERLRAIQQLIQEAETGSDEELAAQAQLTSYLSQNPDSADAWYLVAHVATTPDEQRLALQKALKLDPNHAPARQFMDALDALEAEQAEKAARDKKAPKPPAKEAPSPVDNLPLRSVVNYYLEHGWQVVKSRPKQAVLQKKYGLAWHWAIVIAFMIPVAGLLVFLGNLFARRTKRIILTTQGNGRLVQIGGDVKPALVVDRQRFAQQSAREELPQPAVSYGTALAWAVGLLLVGCCGLSALAVAVDEDTQVNEVENQREEVPARPIHDTGSLLYITDPDSPAAICVAFYTVPRQTVSNAGRFSIGAAVLVLEQETVGQTAWYQVLDPDTGQRGWVQERYLGETVSDQARLNINCN